MKQKSQVGMLALLLAINPLGALAQTTFFNDTFAHGSTINSTSPANATATNTSYQLISAKTFVPNPPTVTSQDLKFGIGSSASATFEIEALFATNPVILIEPGDYIQLTIVFTNSSGILASPGPGTSQLGVGLYNSSQVMPLPGGTNANPSTLPGYAQNWLGYAGQIVSGASRVMTRPAQSTTGNYQDVCLSGSTSSTYQGQTTIGSSTATAVTLTAGSTYTEVLYITMIDPNGLSVAITNTLYSGPNTSGTVVVSSGGIATNATFLTGGFDALALGYQTKVAGNASLFDVSSIQVVGSVTTISGPPTITQQPIGVTVASGGSCASSVSAIGYNMTYQWHRHGTNLLNGGNIYGATSSQLIISSVGSADVAGAGANGYYVTITGAGGYSINSVTNSLVLIPATNLIWTAAGGATWDLNNTVSWQDTNGNPLPFNYGDSVRFDDTASTFYVTLTGNFLSASTVTVDSEAGNKYTLTGTGSIAGPGSLIYTGIGTLALNTANTYSGGTLISNTTTPLNLQLNNYGGLGTGPVTVNNEGGTLETTVTGGNTTGINGSINLQSDFNIKVDGNGTYALVLLGDLASSSGANALTINPLNGGTTNRFRAYGTNTTFNGGLVLDNVDSGPVQALYVGTVLAPYQSSGSQTYNGVISGAGGIVQRGSATTYLNNNQNSYSGGTFPTAGGIGFGADSIPTTGTVTSGPIGTGPLYLAPENGSTTGTGTVLASGGARTIANPLVYPSGTNNLTLVIGGTNDLTFTAPFALNGLDGVTSATYSSRLIQVTDTGAATLAGNITDTSGFNYALTKSGAGTLYLNGANTYPGVTTNTAGVLAGSGSLAGSVVVTTNASIGGGAASGIGTLTIGGSLTMSNANGYFRVNRSGFTSDKVAVTGALSYAGAGTITVTNLGGSLQVGDTFTLFSKAVSGGAALTVTNIGGGIVWSNGLAVNGEISVVSFIAGITPITNSPAITNITLSGSNVILRGNNGQTGGTAYLLMTTNLTKAMNQWKTVATNVLGGPNYTFTGTNALTPVLGQQFYRLSSTNYNP